MVKYRQPTQKPSNVCFTGRGRRMERVKKLPLSFSVRTEDGCDSAAVQTIWQFVGFFWRAQSPSAEKLLLNDTSETGTGKGRPVPLHLGVKVSHEAETQKEKFLVFLTQTLSRVYLFVSSFCWSPLFIRGTENENARNEVRRCFTRSRNESQT